VEVGEKTLPSKYSIFDPEGKVIFKLYSSSGK
jgi:hypothetical protein